MCKEKNSPTFSSEPKVARIAQVWTTHCVQTPLWIADALARAANFFNGIARKPDGA